jgi:hypothetical protein
MTKQDVITKIARAISKMEGYEMLNSKARKNNNPGNLRTWGKTPVEGGFAKFNRAEDGWSALYKQIENNVMGLGSKDVFTLRANGLTFREFFQGQRDKDGYAQTGGYPGYAPDKDGNHSEAYAKYVAKALDVTDIDVKIKSLITG